MPKSKVAFWEAKFARNTARDAEYARRLTAEGWRVVVIWECESSDSERLTHLLRDHFGLTEPVRDDIGGD
jgi:DNA mismatch endonuclease (patch repair protein)